VNSLFECLGGVLPVEDEAAFNVFSALTGTLTTHYSYLATLTSWAIGHGIASGDADGYVRSLFQGVGRALSDKTRSLISSPPTTGPRTEATNASARYGSLRPTPKPSTKPSMTSSPALRDSGQR
jgi:hypothetical protein